MISECSATLLWSVQLIFTSGPLRKLLIRGFWLAEYHFIMDKLIYIPVLLVRRTDLSQSYFHICICIYIWKHIHVINVIKIVFMVTSLRRCCGRRWENSPDVYVNKFLLLVAKRRAIIHTLILCQFKTLCSVVPFLVPQPSFSSQRPLAAFTSPKSITASSFRYLAPIYL